MRHWPRPRRTLGCETRPRGPHDRRVQVSPGGLCTAGPGAVHLGEGEAAAAGQRAVGGGGGGGQRRVASQVGQVEGFDEGISERVRAFVLPVLKAVGGYLFS